MNESTSPHIARFESSKAGFTPSTRLPEGFRAAAVLLLGAVAAGSAQGAIIVDQVFTSGSSDQFFSADITNETGVTLDLGTLNFSQLFKDTANLVWNKSLYTNNGDNTIDSSELSNFINYLKGDNLVAFTIDNIGEVSDGWSGNIGNDGIIDLTNNDFSSDSWDNNRTMETFLGIDNALYTDPATSTIVPISLDSQSTITDFASAKENATALPFTADGLGYNVVPEPSAFGLLLGLGACLTLARRRR